MSCSKASADSCICSAPSAARSWSTYARRSSFSLFAFRFRFRSLIVLGCAVRGAVQARVLPRVDRGQGGRAPAGQQKEEKEVSPAYVCARPHLSHHQPKGTHIPPPKRTMRIPVELIHILCGWNVIGMCARLQHKGGFRHMRVQRTARGWNVPVGKDMHSFATLDEFLDSPLARKSGKSAFLPHTHT